MKAVLQRVSRAEVRTAEGTTGRISSGLLVLLGVMRGDDASRAARLAERVARLRLFEDERGRMDRSLLDVGGGALVVSQVTLCADLARGRRPSLDGAAPPERARSLYERFVAELRAHGVACATGSFGARMQLELVNEGPVTFVLEDPPERSRDGPRPPQVLA